MHLKYRIHFYRNAGNLHISLLGEFSEMCAWALFKTLRQQHKGAFRVFVNTAGLLEITPEGAALFKTYMAKRPLPPDWLYFKGRSGFRIAPDGSRVLICKKREKCARTPADRPEKASGAVRIRRKPPRSINQTITQTTTQATTQATNRPRRKR